MHHEITKIPLKNKQEIKGFLLAFHIGFFITTNSTQWKFCILLFKKKWMHMYSTRWWMGGACAFQTVCAMPSRIQKYLFIVSLEVLSYSFPNGATSVSIGGLILHRWAFFFPFFSFPSLKKLQFGSTSVLALLSFIFWSRPFCRNFIGFRFHHSISIYQKLYSSMWYSFFGFLIFFLALF